jgi:hypothetical protein
MDNIQKHNNFTSGVISAEKKNVVKTKPNLYYYYYFLPVTALP